MRTGINGQRVLHGLVVLCGCLGCGLLAGCERAPASPPLAAPPVTVALPIQREVTDFKDFTGRTDAVQSVAVRARVSGYLTQVTFKEGSDVKEGDVLFKIDVRPYQALLDQAQGQLEQAQANVKLYQANFERAQALATKNLQAISKEALDTAAAQLATAKAQVTSGKAAVDSARLNVGFCTVRSPIDGEISRYLITIGNLVTQDQTELTTIVSQDPMYAYFDVDEQTMLDVQKLIRAGKMKSARAGNLLPVLMELANETGFPHRGTINFVDNRVDPSTGTLQVRGVFPNPLVNTTRVLTAGLFVRVRVFLGSPYRATMISEEAVVSDQGRDFVYIVDDQDTVHYQPVELGQVHAGLRVVASGVKPTDRLIIRGLQRVQPQSKVQPTLAKMPDSATDSGAATGATTGTAPNAAPAGNAQPAAK